jgi:hypothetical protein
MQSSDEDDDQTNDKDAVYRIEPVPEEVFASLEAAEVAMHSWNLN